MNAPIAPPSLGRRSMLAGLATLPVAALPLASFADPFAGYHAEVETLHAAMAGVEDDEVCIPLMGRWAEIDRLAMAGQPTTLAGALGALRMARREHVQFAMLGDPESDDRGDRLVLHLLDGAIAVLRQATGGGLA